MLVAGRAWARVAGARASRARRSLASFRPTMDIPPWAFDVFQALCLLQGFSVFILVTGGLIENELSTKLSAEATEREYAGRALVKHEDKLRRDKFTEAYQKKLISEWNEVPLMDRAKFWCVVFEKD